MLTDNTTIGSDKFTITRYYDSRGNNLYEFYSKNDQKYRIMRYWHDNRNRLKTVDESTDGGTSYKRYVEYFYDVNNNLASAHYGNNTYNAYYYNAANYVTCMDLVNKTDSSKVRHFVYNYRLDGNISSKTENISGFNDTISYTYDSTGRLASENYEGYNNFNVAYTYDASGNRKTASYTGDIVTRTENYTYDLNNRLTQIFTENRYKSYNNVTDISYDKNGNQLRVDKYTKNKTGAFKIAVTDAYNRYSGTSSEEFTYNGLNQLTGYTNTNGSYNGKTGIDAKYKYMANGYRVSKTVNGSETKYLWDKDNIVEFLNSENVSTQKYYRGYQLIADGSGYYYMHNLHGDVVDKFNGAEQLNSYYSNAFGYTRDFIDVEMPNTWGYCDQLYDFESGNYYMRARYYNTETGRFISEDPIKYGDNWYAYCAGNPIMFRDPTGKSKEGDERFSQSVRDDIALYGQIWTDA